MRNWRDVLIPPSATLGDVLARIDTSGYQIALVVERDDRLLGVVTDGDVRRAILQGMQLSSAVTVVMNKAPVTARQGAGSREQLAAMRRHVVHQLPIITENNTVVGLVLIDDLIGATEKPNWAVLMAGGLGARLRPLTESVPKPMLVVRGKPILEGILENLVNEGFRKFFVSVNYRAEMIMDHFGDGSSWGIEISYLREDTRLGTAGALSLLPGVPQHPILVMNGDLLTRANVSSLLEFHEAHKSVATMAVREYDLQVPYGVVHTSGDRITAVVEKPVQKFFINAGIYVLSPQALTQIPADTYFDMPNLFDRLNGSGALTIAFPLRDFWLDIGRVEDYVQANMQLEYLRNNRE
jgi:dTDP-glucose pyrophosphorylase/predicted transcriptional regulator